MVGFGWLCCDSGCSVVGWFRADLLARLLLVVAVDVAAAFGLFVLVYLV